MIYLNDQTLRIIDANLDRATEGLRVLEDVARFVIDSAPVSRRLKDIRHRLHAAFPDPGLNLISARDSVKDVGRGQDTAREPAASLIETVIANARRVEQSLRVLEEMSRLPDAGFNGAVFEESRYALYDIEKELLSRLSRSGKIARLGSGPYHIIDNADEAVTAFESPVAAMQLNQSEMTSREFWQTASDFREYCGTNGGLFFVGEAVDVARASGADGVVLDRNSLPVPQARALLKIDQLIGYSTDNPDEASAAIASGADFIICPECLRDILFQRYENAVIVPRPGE